MTAIPARVRGLVARRPTPPAWLARVGDAVHGIIEPVTRLGWTLLSVGFVAWWAGVQLGWNELLAVAAGALTAVAAGLIASMRRPALEVSAGLVKQRVVVGDVATGSIRAANPRARRVGSAQIEVPVGLDRARFVTPTLGAGEDWVASVTIPTDRRSVVSVGPAVAVNGDPLGVARRELGYGAATELFIHPRTVRLPAISAGWLRDLEGQTTQDLSNSDVAFHTLREYVPGDDRRHVHWRSSAKLDRLMVRQFVDTRRSHVGLVLSTRAQDWASPAEFELGVEAVGSIGRTAVTEGQEVTMIAGHHAIPAVTGTRLLDGLAGVDLEPEGSTLATIFRDATQLLRSASVVLVVVGTPVDVREVRRVSNRFGPDTRIASVTCGLGLDAARAKVGKISTMRIGDLEGLARVLSRGGVG